MRLFILALLIQPSALAMAQSPISNPAISANLLMLYQNSNLNGENLSTERNGFGIQESELNFSADVDPYSHLNLILSVAPENEVDPATGKVNQSWVVEPEEAYVETLRVPYITFKAGRFKAAVGKHNLLHTHAFPFNSAPLANVGLMGDEGLNDFGLSAAGLIPISWFSEITVQYIRGEGENAEFDSASPSDGVGIVHWKNLWDLSENSTLEYGLSEAEGPNDIGGETMLLSNDITWKWRPANRGKYRSAVISVEWLHRKVTSKIVDDEQRMGHNIWTAYQWGERWYTGLRWDNLDTTERWTGNVEFRATEFSSLRLEYSRAHNMDTIGGELKGESKISLQGNFTIGAHPAHSY